MVSAPPSIVWLRHDLRLSDQPALGAALARGGAVVPVFILDEAGEGNWAPGGASRWWLHHALADFEAQLRELGLPLVLRVGASLAELRAVAAAIGAGAVFWNRRYEPAIRERDAAIKAALREQGLEARSFTGGLLFEPGTVLNKTGKPFQVFTPFWRHLQTLEVPAPVPLDDELLRARAPDLELRRKVESLGQVLDALGLLPKIRWDAGLAAAWEPTRVAALRRLSDFAAGAVAAYPTERDRPDHDGTSRLSPYLRHGQLSPREVWSGVLGSEARIGPIPEKLAKYLAEIAWREFSYHLLFHFPHLPSEPLRAEYAAFPWEPDAKAQRAWERGRTGYPTVDAGMRQLYETGWMHNRVRMVVASLLVKHLLQPWQAGAAWFWDTLVDADLASNTQGWQWAAGCGADAAPYFRIFNPMTQGAKFDPHGDYVRRWVPELAALPPEVIHQPWEADGATLRRAGVRLGESYPLPIIDHKVGRQRALAALSLLTAKR